MVYGLLDVPILNGIYENHVLTGGDHLVGDVPLPASTNQSFLGSSAAARKHSWPRNRHRLRQGQALLV